MGALAVEGEWGCERFWIVMHMEWIVLILDCKGINFLEESVLLPIKRLETQAADMKFVLCTLRSGLSGRSVVAAVRMNTFPEEEHNEEEEVEWGLPPGPPPEIRVPFGQKPRREFGERIFDNRETICITVTASLVVAILQLTSRAAPYPLSTLPTRRAS